MKAQILLMFLGIGLLISCTKDDNHLGPESTINGTWNLTSVSGGLASFDIDYQKGDIKWTFNQANSTLTVVNNIGNDKAFILRSGTYHFKIEQNGERQVLFVDNNDYRLTILSIDQDLIITDGMFDGFTAEFHK